MAMNEGVAVGPIKPNEIRFRCPSCHAGLPNILDGGACQCDNCNFVIPEVNGIPLLVKDREVVEQRIEEAKSAGRAAWYEETQDVQWQGPYRHHLQKRKRYVERILESYKRQCGHPLVGLDLGCGDGANTRWLTSHFSRIYASDYNLIRLIRTAQHSPRAHVFMADITDYPTLDNSFDVIFFNHVLEHIPDDEGALREAYRILKPGGLLILGVPNEGALFWQLAYRLQPGSLATSDHLHFYTAKSLSKKTSEAGFYVQDIHPIGWGLPHWRLDSAVRGWKWVDDLFEWGGRALIPSQATSLYLLLAK